MTVDHGFAMDTAIDAYRHMLTGGLIGKIVVKVGD